MFGCLHDTRTVHDATLVGVGVGAGVGAGVPRVLAHKASKELFQSRNCSDGLFRNLKNKLSTVGKTVILEMLILTK